MKIEFVFLILVIEEDCMKEMHTGTYDGHIRYQKIVSMVRK